MRNLNELRNAAHQNAVDHGWHDKPRTFGDIIANIHGECSEAFEDFRNGKGFNEVWYEKDGKPCGIPSELADIIIRVLDFCGAEGIDIEAAVLEKMKYNESRPYRHGGKAV